MSAKPPTGIGGNDADEDICDHPRADLIAMDEFCVDVHLPDKISLSEWCNAHDTLNLTVNLFISLEDAQIGFAQTVTVVRSIIDPATRQVTRERLTHAVQVTKPIQDGMVLAYPGQGDWHGDRHGDLIVIIRIQ